VEDGLNFIPTETNGSRESIFFLQMVPVLITITFDIFQTQPGLFMPINAYWQEASCALFGKSTSRSLN
ncbi:MAG: hypothetical protein AB2562_19410, partial [Candidatus Thiodiazotropha sp.]